MKLKNEPLILILVFGFLLFLGLSSLFSQKLVHEFPQGLQANDAFYKYDRAHYLLETGNFNYQEWYVLEGRKDLLQDDAPLAYVLTAVFSYNSKIPDFDTYQFIGIISKIMAVLVMYLILRKFNPKVALLSLGIAPFIFIKNNFIPFHFGWIPITLAVAILILMIWVILNLELKAMWLVFGLSLAGVLLAHLSEFYYAALITGIMLIYLLIKNYSSIKNIDIKLIKKIIFALIIFTLVIYYYLPMFIYISLSLAQNKNVVTIGTLQQTTFPITLFSDFGFFQYFILFGVIFSLYYCYKQKDKIIYFLPLYALITISNFPLLGMHDRFYQLRYYWPIIFMLFFGLGIYVIWSYLSKINPLHKLNENIKNTIPIVLTLLFIFMSINLYYTSASPQGLIFNEEMWAGMQWVQKNIPENINDNTILVVHGDSYQQHGIFLMFGRIVHQIKDEDYFAKLNTGQVAKNYTIRKFVHGYDYLLRKGFFTFEPVKLGKPEWEQTRGWEERNLCDFDYYVIDKPSRIPQVTQYNLKIRETLLKSGNFAEVFSNGWYSILKNNKLGADCLGN